MILEYISPTLCDYSMPVLKKLLVCLSPIGAQFFDYYIYNGEPKGIQFIRVVNDFTDHYAKALNKKIFAKVKKVFKENDRKINFAQIIN